MLWTFSGKEAVISEWRAIDFLALIPKYAVRRISKPNGTPFNARAPTMYQGEDVGAPYTPLRFGTRRQLPNTRRSVGRSQ